VQNASMQIPRAIGPLVGALFLQAGHLATPFFIAAGLQAAYLALYARFFSAYAGGGVD
jgi:hypothetical protein